MLSQEVISSQNFSMKTNQPLSVLSFIIILLFFSPPPTCSAQTYLALSIGLDKTKGNLGPYASPQRHYLPHDGYPSNSLLVGLSVEHYWLDRFRVSFTSSFTKKKVLSANNGIVYSEDYQHFNHFKQTALLHGRLLKGWYLGAGGNLSFFTEKYHELDVTRKDQRDPNFQEFYILENRSDEVMLGSVFSTSYRLPDFVIEVRYNNAWHVIRGSEDDRDEFIYPFNSIDLLMSFLIQVSKEKKTDRSF